MIFFVAIFLLIAAIAYFNVVQGLFSATLTAFTTILAAVLAVSYHENLALLLIPYIPAQAHAVALVGLFVGIFLIIRVPFDKYIPGNLRFPVLIDKLGAAGMGLIAGVFATGIVTLAAQTLPFSASIFGYSRYALSEPRQIVIPANVVDALAHDATIGQTLPELRDDIYNQRLGSLPPEKQIGMAIPVDEIVLKAVRRFSNNALAGERSFESIHPDYLQELFGQRLGLQTGASHLAINTSASSQVEFVDAGLSVDSPAVDADLSCMRVGQKSLTLAASEAQKVVLHVRLRVNSAAADVDRIFRFSPASMRLLTPAHDAEKETVQGYKNHYPIGTADADGRIFLHRIDDPLLMDLQAGNGLVDLVYVVDQSDLTGKPFDSALATFTFVPGLFIEAKRMGSIPLDGKVVKASLDPKPTTVLRKSAEVGSRR
jgi:hypothetical protein